MKSFLRMRKEREIYINTPLFLVKVFPIQFFKHQLEKVKEQEMMGVRERRNV